MDETRFERWIKASISTAKFDPHMMRTIQGLGQLDVELIDKDQVYLSEFRNRNEFDDSDFALSQQITVSYLWVLGAYEAIRTMGQRIREKEDLVSEDMRKSFVNVRGTFNRLRLPLAKMEAARSHKDTDSRIAYPALNLNEGIAWQVSEDTFITRKELSDQFLCLLEGHRVEQISRSNET